MQTVIGFQVFLSNINNFQTDLFDLDGILTGTTIPDQSGPGSNSNEEVTLHTPLPKKKKRGEESWV